MPTLSRFIGLRVFTGARRRTWSAEGKALILAEIWSSVRGLVQRPRRGTNSTIPKAKIKAMEISRRGMSSPNNASAKIFT